MRPVSLSQDLHPLIADAILAYFSKELPNLKLVMLFHGRVTMSYNYKGPIPLPHKFNSPLISIIQELMVFLTLSLN